MKMFRMKIRVTEETLIPYLEGTMITIEIPARDAQHAQRKVFKLINEDVQADDDCSGLEFIEFVEI